MASKHRTPPTLGKKNNMLEYDIIKPKPILWLFGKIVKNQKIIELVAQMAVQSAWNLTLSVRILTGDYFYLKLEAQLVGDSAKYAPPITTTTTTQHHPSQ